MRNKTEIACVFNDVHEVKSNYDRAYSEKNVKIPIILNPDKFPVKLDGTKLSMSEARSLKKLLEIDKPCVDNVNNKLNTYFEHALNTCKDIKDIDINRLFSEENFKKLFGNCKEGEAVFAIVQWTSLKNNLETIKTGGLQDKSHALHDANVKFVSGLIKAASLPALATLSLCKAAGLDTKIDLNKKVEWLGEKIVNICEAKDYLSANFILGIGKVLEDAVEFAGAGTMHVLGKGDIAEKIMTTDVTGYLKKNLDKLYYRDDFAKTISNSVEKVGTMVTYTALAYFTMGGSIPLVAAIASMSVTGLSMAGQTVKGDIYKNKEYNAKEMLHGLVVGVSAVALSFISKIGIEKVHSADVAKNIATEIKKIFGNTENAKFVQTFVEAFQNSISSALGVVSNMTPAELSKDIARLLKIDTSEKGDWFKVVKAGGISIAAASAFTVAKNFITGSTFYSNVSERLKRTPDNNGNWSGKRGDSKFNSNNPEVVDLEKKLGCDGVKYKDGIPDFSDYSKGDVKISNMTENRQTNFQQADIALAKQRGCSPRDVANWRREHGYTWHELNDMKHCQKIPSVINKTYGHLGGVSECKHRTDMMNDLLGKTSKNGGNYDA